MIVAGAVARRPGAGGHAWVFLQWLLGLRKLGYDVTFVDWVENGSGAAVGTLASVMESFEIPFSLLSPTTGDSFAGLSRAQILERARRTEVLFNVNGYLQDEEILAAVGMRVFLDIDPGFPQMWRELDLADVLARHDRYVTIGENIGKGGCAIPTCALDWITTRQPVVLELWPPSPNSGTAFTSVGSWRGPFDPIEYHGKTYGLRVHEFRKFVELPRATGGLFELALDIHPNETRDLDLFARHGWRLVDPAQAAGDPFSYQHYLQASRAEFMVAKSMYVQTWSGWFSDRSSCYLASAKPVLAQDTGIGAIYPTGEGLVTFSTLEGAIAGVEAIASDYGRHSRAARELAVTYFDSNKVLARLLEDLAVG